MKDSTEIFSEVAHDLIEEAREKKRRLRHRMMELGPNNIHEGIRGPTIRGRHIWLFYLRAKKNHQQASKNAAFIIAAFRKLL